MKKKPQGKGKSFSLIEILVVIAILGVLAISSYIGISQQFKKVRDARRKADLNILRNALEEYYDSRNCYLETLPPCYSSLKLENNEFLSSIPCDPKTHFDYAYVSSGYQCSGHYKLYTKLELIDDPIIDFVSCRFGCGPECQYNYGVSSPNVGLDYCTPTPPPPTTAPTTQPLPPTITPVQYVCAPGGGQSGLCEPFAIPTLSECPEIYPDNPTCNNACSTPANRCKSAKGKYVPTKAY